MVFSMSLEFLLSAFLRRKHFSLEPFPRTCSCSSCCYYCLLHSTCATRPLFHFLRSPVESSASRRWLVAAESLSWKCGRPERQVGASLASYRRRSHKAPTGSGRSGGRSDRFLGGRSAQKKPRKRGQKGQGGLGKGAGCRFQAPGWWGSSAFSR